MQESAAVHEPVANGNATAVNGAGRSPSPGRSATGFTAVNGAHKTAALFRPSEVARSGDVSPTADGTSKTASAISQYHSHGWKPSEGNPNGGHGEPDLVIGKRKRSDPSDKRPSDVNGQTTPAGVTTNSSPPIRSIALDSAIDLTSEEPTRSGEPLTSDSDESDGDHAGVYSRTKSPVERWNRGEPPPKPRPETEAQISAALQQYQQQTQQGRAQHNPSYSPAYHSPVEEREYAAESHMPSDDQYNGDVTEAKRRKRNFSNRTKTGCHTCRKRKKKCDEGKPTCQNCERGNFQCEGYGPKPPGFKVNSQTRAVIPLQSKTPMAPYNGRQTDAPPMRPEEGRSYSHWGRVPPPPLPSAGPLPLPPPPEGDQHRHFVPVAPADPRRSSSTADNWHKPSYSPAHDPHPPPYMNDRLPPNFPPMPVLHPPYPHDQRQPPPPHAHQYPPPQHAAPPPPPSSLHHPNSSHPPPMPMEPWGQHPNMGPYPPHHLSQPGPPPSAPPVGSSRGSATSVSHRSDSFQLGYAGNHSLVEKDKMLRGQPYLHYLDPVLCQERQSCKAAVERYNKAAETTSGISDSERGKLFTQILKPHKRADAKPREPQHPAPDGSIGDHSIVEPPFMCEYGYNIHMGDKCIVENGCFFQDAADIFLGHRVVIGHNVKLYCRTVPLDPHARNKGSRSNMIAGAIKIEEDCFIGADVVVMPFVTIGKGAVVGAGSVVTKDVEENTVVAGNPAKLIRRIEGSIGRHHSQQIQRQQEKMVKRMVEYANTGFSWYNSPRQ